MPVLDQDEVRLLQLLGEGYTVSKAAKRLGISYREARGVTVTIHQKLGVKRTAPSLAIAIRNGELGHPPRQQNLITLNDIQRTTLLDIAYGLTNGEMAYQHFLTVDTAKDRVKVLLRKLRAKNRVHAVYRGFQYGLI